MILIGSTYFFKDYEDFHSKDKDYINIVDEGINFQWVRQISMGYKCTFDIVRHTKEELIEYALNNPGPAMQVGKFLIPEFNQEFGITVDDIKQLKPLIDNLDDKHKYEEIIYNAYIENNDFTLTDEQRQAAYDSYKESRPEEANKYRYRKGDANFPAITPEIKEMLAKRRAALKTGNKVETEESTTETIATPETTEE